MSIVPFLVNELLGELERPNIYDQDFGLPLALHHSSHHHPYGRVLSAPLRAGYLRPWRHVLQDNSGVSNLKIDKDGFKVNLDVQQFKPEELTVKVGFIKIYC